MSQSQTQTHVNELKVPPGWAIESPKTVEQLFALFEELRFGEWSFRGECGIFDKRISSLGRKIVSTSKESQCVELEKIMAQSFLRHSFPVLKGAEKAFCEKVLDQFILMQHYGAPTRLLDWTHSPWVALYFAISEFAQCDKPSVIWCVNNRKLARSTPAKWIEDANKILAAKSLDDYCGLAKVAEPFVLFLDYDVATDRMLAQQSGISFAAPIAADHTKMMGEVCSDCGKVIVIENRNFKRDLMQELSRMNIRASTLFPTLEGVGQLACDELEWSLTMTVSGRKMGV